MHTSANIYTTLALRAYDFVVLVVSNYLAWHCPTLGVLLPHYQQHLGGSAHLEIAVGTGYYPAKSIAALSKTKLVTLLDLNPNTLAYASRRLSHAGYKGKIMQFRHDVFVPLPEGMRGQYDSVALYYLFHCLPGSFPQKAKDVFVNVSTALAPGGVIYGATILGLGVKHNWLGTRLMRLWNSKGVFGNMGDSEEGLTLALKECFQEYEVRIVGRVALFAGRRPKLPEA